MNLIKEFSKRDDEIIKMAELKKVEQESRTMEEFVQEYRKATRISRYKEKLLIKKFKRGINGMIRRKIMKTEQSSRSIEQ